MNDNGVNWDELLALDELGLLDDKPKKPKTTNEQRLIDAFLEIVRFYEEKGRKPDKDSRDTLELMLGNRLHHIERNILKRELLREHDKYSLIDYNAPTDEQEEDLDDELEILSKNEDEEDSIFNLTHVPDLRNFTPPDYVARAKPCADFDQFEELLKDCQRDIKRGDRSLSPFKKVESIKPGTFFIDRGVLVYIADMEEPTMRNGRKQARLRCILDSGQETDVLNSSLAKNLYNGGKIVSPNINDALKDFRPTEGQDRPTGFVYVLRSTSKLEQVREIRNLHKIGFCTTTVEERVKNAMFEPTYLMGGVRIVARHKVYNADAQKFEKTLHDFFNSARVNIDVYDLNGNLHAVREWFQVPLGVINEAVLRVVQGRLAGCWYDRDLQMIADE